MKRSDLTWEATLIFVHQPQSPRSLLSNEKSGSIPDLSDLSALATQRISDLVSVVFGRGCVTYYNYKA
eukprot:5673039-Pleurochrysis_carterae.AAC.4